MAEYPALPLWTDAYLADTTHLTDAEHGVYFQLVVHAWRSPDCRLPNDAKWLAPGRHAPVRGGECCARAKRKLARTVESHVVHDGILVLARTMWRDTNYMERVAPP